MGPDGNSPGNVFNDVNRGGGVHSCHCFPWHYSMFFLSVKMSSVNDDVGDPKEAGVVKGDSIGPPPAMKLERRRKITEAHL